jgi:thioredoxin reductase (NADPH)
VDDDVQVLRALQRDVRSHYRDDYRVVATESANEALDLLKELKLKNDEVPLLISDQRMPEMEGISFLRQAREIHTGAKQLLLTAYSDIDVAIRAINDIRLDYYLLKPWNPPEERLFPIVNELLDDWHALHKPEQEGIRVVGFQWSPKSHRLKEFLAGNLVPFLWMDIEHNENAEKYRASAGVELANLPLVVLEDGTVLTDPTVTDLATRIGLKQHASKEMYDVVIIGGGPSGLAASVYGASEGLKTLLIEKRNPGGQASSSSRIENYLGFPSGLSGMELARRATTQALKFGTEVLTPQEVKSIRLQDGYKITTLSDDSEVHSKAVVVSTGIAYRQLELPGIESFTGAGVYYGSASVEAHACKGEVVYVVGTGNSACQAAMYLSQFATTVNMVIRGEELKHRAAHYLADQISETGNIRVHPFSEVVAVSGNQVLETITLRNLKTGEDKAVSTKALFIYIGAEPTTSWLDGLLLKDENGFIITGTELMKEESFNRIWKLEREPFMSEASVPGIFASGDVRLGALPGISAAVAEGGMAIRFVRKYLEGS